MKFLKENFLQLPIDRQIQSGVIGVSFCVCCLVFGLIIINIVILMNLLYMDVKDSLDQIETQQIKEIALFTDVRINLMADNSKQSIQWIRNFIENNKRNLDFSNQLITLDYSSIIVDVTNGSSCTECIGYKSLNRDFSNDAEYKQYIKILSMSIHLIKQTFKYKNYELPNQDLFYAISFVSIKYDTVFYYPSRYAFNPKYNYETHMQSANLLVSKRGKDFYNNQTIDGKIDGKLINTNDTISLNPSLSFITTQIAYTFPYIYSGSTNALSPVVATKSILYDSTIGDITLEKLATTDYVTDLFLGYWSSEMLDAYAFSSVSKFQGTKIIGTHVNTNIYNQYLNTPSSCFYIIRLHEVLNQIAFDASVYRNAYEIFDCFKEATSYGKFVNYFNQTSINSIKRKVKIPVIRDYLKRDSAKYDTYFKIFKYYLPDTSTRVILNQNFYVNFETFLYVFKNSSYVRLRNHTMYFHFFGAMLMVISFNLAVWYINFFIITIIVFKTAKGISAPINKLINQLTSIGRDNGQDKKENNTGEIIFFPDDKDINELFQICRSLIKGGLLEEHTHPGKVNSIFNAYNNISFVKSNNLIIQEDFIDNKTSSQANSIFFYQRPDEVNEILEEEKNEEYHEWKFTNSDNLQGLLTTESKYTNNDDLGFNLISLPNISSYVVTTSQNQPPSILNTKHTADKRNTNFDYLKYSKNKKSTVTPNIEDYNITAIYDIIENESKRIEHKSFLYSLYMSNSNNGKDLKITNI